MEYFTLLSTQTYEKVIWADSDSLVDLHQDLLDFIKCLNSIVSMAPWVTTQIKVICRTSSSR